MPEEDDQITIDYFSKIKMRVARILEAEEVPDSSKLLKLKVSLGNGTRTIVSGIKKSYSPGELVGKKIILFSNLKPAKLAGIESDGMLLAATDEEGRISILVPDKDIVEGSKVS
jgi:methionyl-tRNA synthetase